MAKITIIETETQGETCACCQTRAELFSSPNTDVYRLEPSEKFFCKRCLLDFAAASEHGPGAIFIRLGSRIAELEAERQHFEKQKQSWLEYEKNATKALGEITNTITNYLSRA